jgi:hypothetical protein
LMSRSGGEAVRQLPHALKASTTPGTFNMV